MLTFSNTFLRQTLYSTAPALVSIWFFTALGLSTCIAKKSNARDTRRLHRLMVLCCIILVLATFIQFFSTRTPEQSFYILAFLLAYTIVTLLFTETRDAVWFPFLGAWLLGSIFESILLALEGGIHIRNLDNGLRLIRLAMLVVLSICAGAPWSYLLTKHSFERQPLLRNERQNIGTTKTFDVEEAATRPWIDHLRGFRVFVPILWPAGDRLCQASLAIVALLLVVERILGVLLPWQLGNLLDDARSRLDAGSVSIPWVSVGFYIFLLWLQGPAGLIVARSFAEIPAQQFAHRKITAAAFEHIMKLDMEFHSSKDSSEIIRAIEQGEALQELVEFVGFECIPLVCDIIVACVFLYALFDAFMILIMLATAFFCVFLSQKSTVWMAETRRAYNEHWRTMCQIQSDAIVNWQVVLQFSGHSAESQRYRRKIAEFHLTEKKFFWAFYGGGAVHNLVIFAGQAAAFCWGFYNVKNGRAQVGRFVTLVAYLHTIRAHLASVSKFIRKGAQMFTDAERLAEVLNTPRTVLDSPDALPLRVTNGLVEFSHVHFAYPKQQTPALRHVSLTAEPGQTIALVGSSGSGKSTIGLLLGRFYDIKEGHIRIDSQDIKNVTVESLRKAIGWVPQQSIIFNTSILENVRYGRPDATEADVERACREAAIDSKIESLPERYLSVVGERGVKLSGGEKQRLTIARLLVNDPKIVVLDEATSALDTETEMFIKSCLQTRLVKKTVFIIAHRLSTIREADKILVVEDGEIVEHGKHDELLEKGGRYLRLWRAQTTRSGPCE